jgi:UDP-GlcNAc:undecaprenyl-phosphate/decaprenyl-phosphate GlcNAc-1-phosphate transferase
LGWKHYLFLVALAGSVTLALTPLVRDWSLKRGLVDLGGGRKVHKGAMSRLGGIAMFVGFTAALVVEYLGERYWNWGGGLVTGDGASHVAFTGAALGLVIIFITGVLDDILTLSPGVKLLGQLIAAGVVMKFGLRVDFLGNPFGGGGLVDIGILTYPITLLWILGFTNVINLIDGLDGLAAGVTAIAVTSFLVLAVQGNQLIAATLAAVLIGCCVGFLRYNFNPASIIMGDSGAMFLGFALACISLLGVMKSVVAITLIVPLLVIGVPIFDTASAIIRRARHGQPIQEADRGHIHHRLLDRGFNQRQTVLIIYVWSIGLAVGGYAMRWAPAFIKIGAFLVLGVLSALMANWLGLFEAAHIQAPTAEAEE